MAPLLSVEDALWQVELAAESIGWQPLEDGAYLHVGDSDALVIGVGGVAEAGMAGMNVLLVGW